MTADFESEKPRSDGSLATCGRDKSTPTAIHRVRGYDVEVLEREIRGMLDELGIVGIFAGKHVVIKPNLVMKKSADAAATTHPAVLEALLRVLGGEGCAKITIAESPPGIYSEAALRGFYNACGIASVAERYGAELNFDTSVREVALPDAKTAKRLSLIAPILDADIIVNLAKLKSHALTKYSGAIKNFYGTIPGLDKVETHARYSDYADFGSLLVDLCGYHVANAPTLSLLDGILAMEGNGPTGGNPRRLDCLIAGMNPFNVDSVGAAIIGFDKVIMLDEAKRRGFTDDASRLTIVGEPLASLSVSDFKLPDSASGIDRFNNLFGGRFKELFAPRLIVERKLCVACGACARSCPKSAISFADRGGKKFAVIDRKSCIRCFCCQELCPVKAVVIHKNPIIALALRS